MSNPWGKRPLRPGVRAGGTKQSRAALRQAEREEDERINREHAAGKIDVDAFVASRRAWEAAR